MLQAGEGVLGHDSDIAAHVSQLGAFPGVPFQVFGAMVPVSNPDLTSHFLRMPTNFPILPSG